MADERDIVRNSLDDLLREDIEIEEGDQDFQSQPIVQAHDYDKSRTKAEGRAKKMMHSLLKFYVSNDFISENDYIRANVKTDQETLSGLIFHLENADRAIVTLMRTIESGELSARMFEVLSALQKSYIDILKVKTAFVMNTEEHMKKLSNDYDTYQSHRIEAVQQEQPKQIESNTHRGTKSLLSEMNEEELDGEDSGI